MDADHFAALLRSLWTAPSRRTALRILAGSALGLRGWHGLDEARAADAKKCKKLKDKQKRKKCLKKARATACTPNCAGKQCGDDGCGGSCGSCTGGSCTGGTCVCPTGQELCLGQCRIPCVELIPNATVRRPDCSCCSANTYACNPAQGLCCSGICAGTFPLSQCAGKPTGADCTFGGECASGVCTNLKCT